VKRDLEAFSGYYVGGTGVSGADPRVSPIYAPDLHDLPPALVVTAGFDVLRDEGDAYAAALESAGNVVRLLRFPTLGHVFNHATHHRGQITAAITAMGYPCPEIDWVWMLQAESQGRTTS
jgi:acetyl esterase